MEADAGFGKQLRTGKGFFFHFIKYNSGTRQNSTLVSPGDRASLCGIHAGEGKGSLPHITSTILIYHVIYSTYAF